ncbi:serine hydrolase family protein [Candidatus Woesearchaeota archaeon]|nr:serine hydrolase family protein [Candidatus Woesearchaeota archaeon]
MTNVLIIHGSYGHPKENWFPWLKSELEKLGCKVFVPKFPTPKNQKLDVWLGVLKDYTKYLDKNSIMVGHSMGCALILRQLELLNKQVNGVFLVSGFTKDLWKGKYSEIIDTFFDKPFDWKKIKRNAKYFVIYQSDNDSLVPISMGEEIAKNLDGELIVIKNAGHFNEESGYTKFNLLLDKIKGQLG